MLLLKLFRPTFLLLFFCLILCSACKDLYDDQKKIDKSQFPQELFRTEEQTGSLNGAGSCRWYYFNGAVGSRYELTSREADTGSGQAASIRVSAYHADKSEPYFQNEAAGQHIIESVEKNERVYIKVEQAGQDGGFALSYRINNAALPPTWTIMIYMNAGMYLEDYCVRSVGEMIAGYHADCGINLLVLLDKESLYDYYGTFGVPFCGFKDTRLFVINEDGIRPVSGGREMEQGITETTGSEYNLGDARTLKQFIAYGKNNYPALHYGLIIKAHGSGSGGCCDDESDGGDRLHPGELTEILDVNDSVDLLGFNTCYMGSAEVAYQFRVREPEEEDDFHADILVASACLTDPLGWNYRSLLGRISTQGGENGEPESLTGGVEKFYQPDKMSALELGRIITEEERDGLYGILPEAGDAGMLTCYDLNWAADVKKSVDRLAVLINGTTGERGLFEQLRDSLNLVLRYYMVYPAGSAEDKAQRKASPLYDLVSLCEGVMADSRFSTSTHTAAGEVLSVVDKLIVYSYNGQDTSNRYGLSIFFSNGNDTYKEEPMFSYHWWYNALDVSGRVSKEKYYGKLAWCRDKEQDNADVVDNWFEMLDAWYDENDNLDLNNGERGGWNGYCY
jgi:clostripain